MEPLPARPRTGSGSPHGLATRAAREAFRLRLDLGIPLNEAVCVYDAAERLGLEVRFVDVPSLEGMYVRPAGPTAGQPLILISAHRPPGRQASTGGHELGHHQLGHGTRIDQYIDEADAGQEVATAGSAEEVLASAFGAFFLMPRAAVERGFRRRGFTPESATAEQVFIVATWLGVGFATLVHHMRSSLRLLSANRAGILLRQQPKRLRTSILGTNASGNLVVADEAWSGRPIDLQVGDTVILPAGTVVEASEGQLAAADFSPIQVVEQPHRDTRMLVSAVAPGLGRVVCGDWAAFVRVSRRGYIGRNTYRHLEGADDESEALGADRDLD